MSNRGKIWTEAELAELLHYVKNGDDTDVIAVKMGRSSPAITARIGMTMAAELAAGSHATDVSTRWGKTADEVNMFVARYDQIDRARAPRMGEIVELLQVLAAAVLEPAAVTAEQREFVRARVAVLAAPAAKKQVPQ